MSTGSPTKRRQQAFVSPRLQEVRDDEELHDGAPIIGELALVSQPPSVEGSPGGLEPARNPLILLGAFVENLIDWKYPGISPEDRRALFLDMASHMTRSTGVDFEAAAHDSLADKRSEYIATVEQIADSRLDRLGLNVAKTERTGLVLSSPNTGVGPVRGITFPPRSPPQRSLSMPDARTLIASRALVAATEASPFPTVHVQDSAIIGQQTLMERSRLTEEYLVHEMIGKGGFGEVFKVVHKLDHGVYAMKQIRMRASDFVKEDLNVGIRRVLEELRTLARLEHRNIVRYYHSWTEYNQGLAVSPPEPAENSVEHLSTIAEEPSFSNGSNPTDASGPNIVFENSESESADSETSESVSMDTESLDDGGVVVFEEPSESGFNIVFENSESADRETSNSVSEDVNVVFEESSDEITSTKEAKNAASCDTGLSEDSDEVVTENASSVFADGSSAPDRALIKRHANINEPTVTIYFTMSLHPLSLTKYITAKRPDRTKDGHCFCPLPSLHIFDDILDGVEYLHSEGIVHRDLKPGNIFLNVGERMECCDRPGFAVVPKIGDFGLVAVIDTEHAPLPASSRKEHLGTTFYSAPEGGRNPAVDVWALGIILFELLYMFDTASERAIVLGQLTNGASDALPIDKKFAEIVKGCCRKEARERLTVPELKQAVAKAIDELEAKVNPVV